MKYKQIWSSLKNFKSILPAWERQLPYRWDTHSQFLRDECWTMVVSVAQSIANSRLSQKFQLVFFSKKITLRKFYRFFGCRDSRGKSRANFEAALSSLSNMAKKTVSSVNSHFTGGAHNLFGYHKYYQQRKLMEQNLSNLPFAFSYAYMFYPGFKNLQFHIF